MVHIFDSEDIGRRVLLCICPDKPNFKWHENHAYEVPYESIIRYKFIRRINHIEKILPKIRNTSPVLKKVDPILIGKALGAEYVNLECDILKVNKDYLLVKSLRSY